MGIVKFERPHYNPHKLYQERYPVIVEDTLLGWVVCHLELKTYQLEMLHPLSLESDFIEFTELINTIKTEIKERVV